MSSGVYSSLITEYKRLVGLGLKPTAVRMNHELQSELLAMVASKENRLKKFYGMDVLTDDFLSVARILVDSESVPEFAYG